MFPMSAQAITDTLLVDSCVIRSAPAVGSYTVDPTTLVAEIPAGSIVYEGPCKASPRAGNRSAETPTNAVEVDEIVLKLPVDVETRFVVGQVVTIDSDPSSSQFEIVRVPFRSIGLTVSLTCRRSTSASTMGDR